MGSLLHPVSFRLSPSLPLHRHRPLKPPPIPTNPSASPSRFPLVRPSSPRRHHRPSLLPAGVGPTDEESSQYVVESLRVSDSWLLPSKALQVYCTHTAPDYSLRWQKQRQFTSTGRSYICFKERGHHTLPKATCKSNADRRIFNSVEPHEAKLSNDEVLKDKILADCGTDQECVTGGIVALGKFDALHIGHRELAIEASKIGSPFLLSFAGIEKVLGWPSRPPIVAKSDRKRVLSSWTPLCGNVVPLEFQVEFSNVRHLTPRQFIEKLSKDFRVSGVVAGENYRFGYKASGDAQVLVRLCKEYGLEACIVRHVMDKVRRPYNGAISNGINFGDKGQVSSTRVRGALAMGDMDYVSQLLGRKHRLVFVVNKECQYMSSRRISVPKSCVLNQSPGDGKFDNCSFLVDDLFIADCSVLLDSDKIDIELYSGSLQDVILEGQLIGIEFG